MPKHSLFYIIILLLALLLRIINLDKDETWSDEKLSVTEANGLLSFDIQPGQAFTLQSIKDHNTLHQVTLSTLQGDGGNGIVYITCLHYWTKVFGNSDFSVRLLSLLTGLLLVIVVYYLTIALFDNKTLALWCMALIAFHPRLVECSQETRAYALALLFSTSATWVLIRMIKQHVYSYVYLIPLSLLMAASFLTHYSTLYILLSLFIILIITLKFEFKKWIKLAPYGVLALSLVLAWLLSYGFEGMKLIAERNQHYTELSISDPTNPFYARASFYNVMAGITQNLLAFSGNTLTWLGLRIMNLIPLLILPLYFIIRTLMRKDNPHAKNLRLLVLLSCSALLYATILSWIAGHIISFQHTYAVFSSPYFVILLGYALYNAYHTSPSGRHRILNNTLIILQISLMTFSTTLIYFGYGSHTHTANPYQLMAANIEQFYKTEQEPFQIHYGKVTLAKEVNKYLDVSLQNIPQIVDSTENENSVYLVHSITKERININY